MNGTNENNHDQVSPESSSSQSSMPSLGDLLIQAGLISQGQLDSALKERRAKGNRLGQVLVQRGWVSESQLGELLRAQGRVPCLNLYPEIVDKKVARELGEELSRKYGVVAINRIAGVTAVAMSDPCDVYSVDELALRFKGQVLAVHAESARIAAIWDDVFLGPISPTGKVGLPGQDNIRLGSRDGNDLLLPLGASPSREENAQQGSQASQLMGRFATEPSACSESIAIPSVKKTETDGMGLSELLKSKSTKTNSAMAIQRRVQPGDPDRVHCSSVQRPPKLDENPLGELEQEVVETINLLLADANAQSARRVHFEARRDRVSVRFRVGGRLRERRVLPKEWQNACMNYLEALIDPELGVQEPGAVVPASPAGSQTAEGIFMLHRSSGSVAVHVSLVPTLAGREAVCRFLLDGDNLPDLESLGLSGMHSQSLHRYFERGRGLLVVSGQVGFSECMHALTKPISTTEHKIVSVEEAIGMYREGVTQVHEGTHANASPYARIASALEQDPDVLLVDEVNDADSLALCLKAARRGTFVVMGLAAADSLSALARLQSLQADPQDLTQNLCGVIHQQAVPALCAACRVPVQIDPALLQGGLESSTGVCYQPGPDYANCAHCNGSGFQGGVRLIEFLEMTPALGHALVESTQPTTWRAIATNEGWFSLSQDAAQKVSAGLISIHDIPQNLGGAQ